MFNRRQGFFFYKSEKYHHKSLQPPLAAAPDFRILLYQPQVAQQPGPQDATARQANDLPLGFLELKRETDWISGFCRPSCLHHLFTHQVQLEPTTVIAFQVPYGDHQLTWRIWEGFRFLGCLLLTLCLLAFKQWKGKSLFSHCRDHICSWQAGSQWIILVA